MAVKQCAMISLEGIDGAGKTNHTGLLRSALEKRSLKVESIHFPYYASWSGNLIEKALKGEARFESEAMLILFALNRVELKSKIQEHCANSDVIIFDRYSESEFAYGLAQGHSKDWLKSLEARMPVADLVILLDTDPETACCRVQRRDNIHIYEQAPFLDTVRRNYIELAACPPFAGQHWRIVDTSRDIRIVHEEICSLVNPFLDKFMAK